MGILYELCFCVRRIAVFGELHAVINSLELFMDRKGQFDWIVHSLIVIFEIRGCNLPIPIKNMLNNIVERDSKESGAILFNSFRYMSLVVSMTWFLVASSILAVLL